MAEKRIRGKRQKVYTVHYLMPILSWEGVKATSEKEAISKCELPPYVDLSEPGKYLAIEE
jgi:hypothetical protein